MMGTEDSETSSSGFAGMAEKFSIDYLTQIANPMREIKDTYKRLRRDWTKLPPRTRLELYRLMESDWEILKNSTTALSEISGYPFSKRLQQVEYIVRRELKLRIGMLVDADRKATVRSNLHPCSEHGLPDETDKLHWKLKDLESSMALDRVLRLVGESERALFRCGVLLSALYSGHDLLEDFKSEIGATTVPTDLGQVQEPKRRKKDA